MAMGGNHSTATESFQGRMVAAVVGKRAAWRRVFLQEGKNNQVIYIYGFKHTGIRRTIRKPKKTIGGRKVRCARP